LDAKFPSNLLYRKQFFFGPQPASFENWRSFEMPDGYILSSHPDLEVTRVTLNNFQATLLGYILDPDRTKDNNEQILTRLCATAANIPQFIELTDSLSGRWILFLRTPEVSVVLNDPAGLRTIFYHLDTQGRFWLASHSGLIAPIFNFSFAADAIEYMEAPRFKHRNEGWFTGDRSPYSEIKHLLPNHLLDLKARVVKRFWPTKSLQKYDLDKAVILVAELLKNSIIAARNRAPLALSMSSGVDSRTMFSASKDLVEGIFWFSMLYRDMTLQHDDIRVPKQIAEKINYPLHLVDCNAPPSKEFDEIFSRHVIGLKYDWASLVEGRYNNVPRDSLVVKGSISEIVRCRYFAAGAYPYRVTLRKMVNLMNVGEVPLVYDTLQDWMIDALPVEKLNYKLLDMLSWECEVGNYLSMGQLLYDLAQEDFCPLNNRKLLKIMLGVDPKYRSYPDHIMQRRIITQLWPELAEFPFTPSRKVPHRTWRDSKAMNILRWMKYLLFEEKHGRLDK
jgi:hypothetical protein